MNNYKPRTLKRQVSVRTTAAAGERLDKFLKDNPGLPETKVTEAALNWYFDKLAATMGNGEETFIEIADTLTPG